MPLDQMPKLRSPSSDARSRMQKSVCARANMTTGQMSMRIRILLYLTGLAVLISSDRMPFLF